MRDNKKLDEHVASANDAEKKAKIFLGKIESASSHHELIGYVGELQKYYIKAAHYYQLAADECCSYLKNAYPRFNLYFTEIQRDDITIDERASHISLWMMAISGNDGVLDEMNNYLQCSRRAASEADRAKAGVLIPPELPGVAIIDDQMKSPAFRCT